MYVNYNMKSCFKVTSYSINAFAGVFALEKFLQFVTTFSYSVRMHLMNIYTRINDLYILFPEVRQQP